MSCLEARLLGALLVVAMAVAGCASPPPPEGGNTTGTGGGGPGQPSAVAVRVLDNQYEPPELEVPAGATVHFNNEGIVQHTVTVRKQGSTELLADHDLAPGESASVTFADPGVYQLRCTYHSSPDFAQGQVGRVTAT